MSVNIATFVKGLGGGRWGGGFKEEISSQKWRDNLLFIEICFWVGISAEMRLIQTLLKNNMNSLSAEWILKASLNKWYLCSKDIEPKVFLINTHFFVTRDLIDSLQTVLFSS